MLRRLTITTVLLAAALWAVPALAAEPLSLQWETEVHAGAGGGDFAPYYMASGHDGISGVSPCTAYARASAWRQMSDSTRFSYGFGADLMAGYVSPIDYLRRDPETGADYKHGVTSGYICLQQLWGEVKWRSLFVTAGMKRYDRGLHNSRLGSGDYVLSANARPIPQVRAGFIDFQDVPLTNGWLQVRGELAYGKFIDGGWIEDQYNRYNYFTTTGAWFHHKSLYLRVGGHQPLTATVGMQHAVQFGGTNKKYLKGEEISSTHIKSGFSQFIKSFLPTRGEGSDFYDGNHVGAWDVRLRYRLRSGATLSAYCQFPWEDGSGIGKLNGWDGIWGVEYEAAQPGIVDNVVAEYIDFTNQSGPMHWAPGDFPGTSIPNEATGADDYYNNYLYDGWSNYGMSIGSPFVMSPAYNLDGYPRYTANRLRGFHIGIGGTPAPGWQYRLLVSHRTSWGTPFIPLPHRRHDTSMMAEATWQVPSVPGLSLTGAFAFDHGKLYGNNTGASISVQYSGSLTFKRNKR
ncbi:MAG TPA: hypothetical protein DC009_09405 [Porphyromonadaceae bacterium]|nr:hypothetical protein [Porphyromonadaceae bacterium]